MIPLLVISTFGYLLLLMVLAIGLSRVTRSGDSDTDQPVVSVLVAARNEETRIGACLDALLAQDYPHDKLEVVVIDDDSEDATSEIVQSYHDKDSRIKLITAGPNPDRLGPKKNALRWGIMASKGDILITTDADCTPPPAWLQTIVTYFQPNVGTVLGPSVLQSPNHWLKHWLVLENLGNIAIYAASAGLSFPVGAQGANLAYRREVWELLGFGAEGQTFSGDDDLFVQRIAKDGRWQVRYALEPDAVVPHHHQVTGTGTVRQKHRHLSAVRWYRPEIVLLAALVLAYHLLLAVGLVAGLFTFPIFLIWLLCMTAKTLADGSVLERIAHRTQMAFPWRWLPIAEILRPWAMIFMVPMSLIKPVTWKGRVRSAASVTQSGESS